ncbi:TraI/MobA(P) family conjugative relaxase [Herbaspirillum huttiense]|uniref:TraI/MobA(P) family conjugative relaxase n=1 Tax=Herbaspirillum huttiense TaxID=863372 RepID=UPI00381BD54F
MIVHVADGRRDRKSSFKVLTKYVTEGLDPAGLDGSFAAQHGFDDITAYVVADAAGGERKADVEKTLAVEAGNVTSLRTAHVEMSATAARCKVVDDPVIHYILSWREDERPTNDQIFEAARHSLKALGVLDHQYILAIHGNTDNIHCHVVFNKIHPTTFRSKHLEWLHKTLHRAARETEIEHGWRHDPGLYSVYVSQDGTKSVVETAKMRAPLTGQSIPINPKAAKYEMWHGQMSLDRWCKEVAGPRLVEALASESSWSAVHKALADFGLEMQYVGGSSYRIAAKDEAGKVIASIAASKVIRQLSGVALEAKLGAFQPPAADLIGKPTRAYKRDPQARLDRRMERQAARDELHERFKAQVSEIKHQLAEVHRPARQAILAQHNVRRDALFQRQKSMRDSIKGQTSLPNKQAHYTVVRLLVMRESAELAEQKKIALAALAARTPKVPTWREFVQAQAQLGDQAAISALRGLTYQDKRDAKKGLSADAPLVADEVVRPALFSPQPLQHSDPVVQVMKHMRWEVGTNGTVTYRTRDGQKLFADKGSRIDFEKAQLTDAELKAVLSYAKERWNGQIRISGGDAQFRARVTKAAQAMKIQVLTVGDFAHAHRGGVARDR